MNWMNWVAIIMSVAAIVLSLLVERNVRRANEEASKRREQRAQP